MGTRKTTWTQIKKSFKSILGIPSFQFVRLSVKNWQIHGTMNEDELTYHQNGKDSTRTDSAGSNSCRYKLSRLNMNRKFLFILGFVYSPYWYKIFVIIKAIISIHFYWVEVYSDHSQTLVFSLYCPYVSNPPANVIGSYYNNSTANFHQLNENKFLPYLWHTHTFTQVRRINKAKTLFKFNS